MLLYPKDRGTTSVIITCHEYEIYLEEAICSVLEQDAMTDIVVVNDAPSNPEPCLEIASKYPNIRVLQTDYHSPLLARKYGYEHSHGKYVIFLDADDKLGVNYINNALDIIEDNGIVYSNMQYFGADDARTDYASNLDKSMICLTNFIHVGSMVKRKLVDISGAFDHPPMLADYHEDWYFWRKLITNTDCDIIKQTGLYHARIHNLNRSKAIRKSSYHDTRGTSGDSITICCTNPSGYKGRLSKSIDWPYTQTHEVLPAHKIKTKAANFSTCTHKEAYQILNHMARFCTTDWVLFYNDEEQYDNICNRMLAHVDHKHGIIHDTQYDMLECTLVATLLLRGKLFGDVDEFKKEEKIKYV